MTETVFAEQALSEVIGQTIQASSKDVPEEAPQTTTDGAQAAQPEQSSQSSDAQGTEPLPETAEQAMTELVPAEQTTGSSMQQLTEAMPVPEDDPLDEAAPCAGGNVIPDPEFQKHLNQQLQQDENHPITEDDMKGITNIYIGFGAANIKSIQGIQYAVNLTQLNIQGDRDGLEEIRSLTKLESVQLQRIHNLDLTIFQNMNNLGFLSLQDCTGFQDLTGLAPKPRLGSLNIVSSYQQGEVNLQSLNGLSTNNFPLLRFLTCSRCNDLTDISALKELSTLTELYLGGNSKIQDITPLQSCTQLTTLNLDNVPINDSNRKDYQDTIRSLTQLQKLWLPSCQISDQDLEMFQPLQNLTDLVLNANQITTSEFCRALPAGMQKLGLSDNDIKDMSGVSGLTELTILGMSDNPITDLTFLTPLTKLKPGGVRTEEGTANFPTVLRYDYNDKVAINQSETTLRIPNPFFAKDGSVAAFRDAFIDQSSSTHYSYTVRYDENSNEIVIENLQPGHQRISVKAPHQIPVSNGEFKYTNLWVRAEVNVNALYTVSYDWGTDAPAGQTLPADTKNYNSADEAKAAMDTTYTKDTVVIGEKGGKKGSWKFSGWTATVDGKAVNFSGSWTFTEDVYTVSYNWGTAFPAGQTLPTDTKNYNTPDEAKAAMDTTYTKDTVVIGEKGGKKGSWQFSGWTPTVNGQTVSFSGSWTFTEDVYTVNYDWGTTVPAGQTLPTDTKNYNTPNEAKAAMDTTYTKDTVVIGEKGGKKGSWKFSGWTATVDGKAVNFSGSWTFTEDIYTVSYNWGTAFPAGQTLPTDTKNYNTPDEAKAAMDTTYTKDTVVIGEKGGKKGSWKFSGWTPTVNGQTVSFSGNWVFTEKAVDPVAPTPAPTPAPTSAPTPTPAPTSAPAAPSTGDNSSMMLWLLLALASGSGLLVVKSLRKKED